MFEEFSLQGLLAICPLPEIKLVSVLGSEFRNDAQPHIYTVLHLEFFFTLRSCIQTNLVKTPITLVIGLLTLSQNLL